MEGYRKLTLLKGPSNSLAPRPSTEAAVVNMPEPYIKIYWISLGCVLEGQESVGYFYRNRSASVCQISWIPSTCLAWHWQVSVLKLSINIARTICLALVFPWAHPTQYDQAGWCLSKQLPPTNTWQVALIKSSTPTQSGSSPTTPRRWSQLGLVPSQSGYCPTIYSGESWFGLLNSNVTSIPGSASPVHQHTCNGHSCSSKEVHLLHPQFSFSERTH